MLRKMTKALAGLAVALMIPGLACMTGAAQPQPAAIPVTTGEAAAAAVDAQIPTVRTERAGPQPLVSRIPRGRTMESSGE